MWRWDQGRLAYFQFDNLKALAHLALRHNLKTVDKGAARAETGLPFPPDDYPQLWRNYSRVVKLTLLVHEEGDRAVPTNVARLFAQEGGVTVDEYFHFFARTFTDPSPALTGWSPSAGQRYPLAFALRYGLCLPALVWKAPKPCLPTSCHCAQLVIEAFTDTTILG